MFWPPSDLEDWGFDYVTMEYSRVDSTVVVKRNGAIIQLSLPVVDRQIGARINSDNTLGKGYKYTIFNDKTWIIMILLIDFEGNALTLPGIVLTDSFVFFSYGVKVSPAYNWNGGEWHGFPYHIETQLLENEIIPAKKQSCLYDEINHI